MVYLKEINFSSHFQHLKWIMGEQNTQGTYIGVSTYVVQAHTYGFRSFLLKFAVHALPNGGTVISREMYEEFELADKHSTEASSECSYDEFDAEKHDITVVRRTRYYIITI